MKPSLGLDPTILTITIAAIHFSSSQLALAESIREFKAVDSCNLVAHESGVLPAKAKAVVLLLASDGVSWNKYQPIITRLNFLQCYSLAIDSRGQDGSVCKFDGSNILLKDFKSSDWAMLPSDLKRIIDLGSGKIWPKDLPVFLVGGLTGANTAALVAEICPRVKGIVLLSPTLDSNGLKIEDSLKNFTGKVMLVCSSGDSKSKGAIRILSSSIPINRLSKFDSIMGKMRGVNLLRSDPFLPDKISNFIGQKNELKSSN